jgi:hypothetical protein
MKHALLVAALLAAPLISPSPAFAADGPPAREYKPVADKPVAEIDPAKSYIIVQTESATPLTFIRRPDKEDIDDYLRRRQEALAKAHGKWEKKQANWVRDAAAWDKGGSSRTGPRPVKPVEPTDANLAFPAIEQENMVSIGPFNRFAKEKGRSIFLHMVPPGHYAFYGPIIIAAAAGGTCLCMGSIQFEVKPGQIVNTGTMVGTWMAERAKAKAEGRPVLPISTEFPGKLTTTSWQPPAPDKVDPRLAAFTIVPADLRASGRVPNYFGLQIDRLTPVPGVLDYDRDKIIDVKAQRPAG